MKVLLGCVIALTTTASAQSTQYGPLALRMPASARSLAMADIGITSRDDDVIFYNPAQLTIARGTSMSFERMSPDVRGATMSTVLRLGSGGLGLGVNYLEYRAAYAVYPISRDDITPPSTGQPAGSAMLASLGFSQVVKKYRIGASANYAADEVGFNRFRNIVGDIGLARDFGRYTAALSLQHMGAAMVQDAVVGPSTSSAPNVPASIRPPMKATVGGGWSGSAGPLDITATVAASALREGNVSSAVGAEASWSWLSGYAISARGGYRYPRSVADARYTGGVGFVADRVSIDLAAEVMNNDRVGVRGGFRVR